MESFGVMDLGHSTGSQVGVGSSSSSIMHIFILHIQGVAGWHSSHVGDCWRHHQSLGKHKVKVESDLLEFLVCPTVGTLLHWCF